VKVKVLPTSETIRSLPETESEKIVAELCSAVIKLPVKLFPFIQTSTVN